MTPERAPIPPAAAALRSLLLTWYGERRRDLPWRHTRDPYAVWISESMLQQTRVETVIPYYTRFLERFPTVEVLAAAAEEEVLASWSGLGYYRRARSLHTAARRMVELFGGRFPRARKDALTLPGVGPYTAGAVLSIAYGAHEPLVDGNVARVFARLHGLEGARGSSALAREAWAIALRLVTPGGGPPFDPGALNQALMELGALVCSAAAPSCGECPLAESCVAARTGRVAELPRAAPRRAPLDVALEVLLVERHDQVLLVRRPPDGRMAGMWELPTRELAEPGGAARLWPEEHALSGEIRAGGELLRVRHAITHHRIRALLVRATWTPGAHAGAGDEPGAVPAWHPRADVEELALTGLTKKILARVGQLEGARGAPAAVGHAGVRGDP